MAIHVSKEELFEELETIIARLNSDSFGIDPDKFLSATAKPNKKIGLRAVSEILKKHKKTTLYELSRAQIEDAIDWLHSIPVRGM